MRWKPELQIDLFIEDIDINQENRMINNLGF